MTENRRIFLNIAATYGRSLYGILLGLMCGRWTLMALGEVDYGLNGVVGGLTVFIGFLNSILAGSNSRFYAFSVGAAKNAVDKSAALEECRRWFNTALSVHTIVPFILIAIGYPLGVYAVEHWLTIPPERVHACIWVFRFVCISCFVGMVNVPFTAMYGAKQYIAELTIYSFVTSTLNVIVLYYMVTHPDVWLIKFAAWGCLISVVPQLIICIRACHIFPECKINIKYMWDKTRLIKLGSYSVWKIMGVGCGLLRTNGISIVINKFFGPRMNAAQAVGISVQGHCYSLAGSMQGAFAPVITQACGAGDWTKMNKFAIRTCKFNVLLGMLFIIPLASELSEVMRLWLKNPPAYSVGICYCMMVLHFCNVCTTGQLIVVNAVGKVAMYQTVLSAVNIFTLPLAIGACYIWRSIYALIIVQIVMEILNSIGRLFFARHFARTSIWAWLKEVFVPALIVVPVSFAIGFMPRLIMGASFFRVCITTISVLTVFIPLCWYLWLSAEEQMFVSERIKRIVKRR